MQNITITAPGEKTDNWVISVNVLLKQLCTENIIWFRLNMLRTLINIHVKINWDKICVEKLAICMVLHKHYASYRSVAGMWKVTSHMEPFLDL